jgi:intron-binding protein aquarius
VADTVPDILLSLVRTKAIGHIRDVRRLVVALSRARLGLYIFARARLFENCYELTPALAQLLQRPTELVLVPNEPHPATRLESAAPTALLAVRDVHHMLAVVRQVAEQATALAAAQLATIRDQMAAHQQAMTAGYATAAAAAAAAPTEMDATPAAAAAAPVDEAPAAAPAVTERAAEAEEHAPTPTKGKGRKAAPAKKPAARGGKRRSAAAAAADEEDDAMQA